MIALRGLRRNFLPSAAVLRVLVYFLCVLAFLAVLAARSLHAHAGELARALGRGISDLPEISSEAETLWINGARFHHARTHSRASVTEVLDQVEAHCERNPGSLAGALAEVASRDPGRFDRHAPKDSTRKAVFRGGSEDDGSVICFAGVRGSGLSGLVSATQRFIATSDLSAFGHVRYVFAERGEGDSTTVVMLWTDSELNLGKMFPATGDAAGSDSAVLARPPKSRRTLSAGAADMPYSLRVYESTLDEQAMQRFYAERMEKEGWLQAAADAEEGTTTYFAPDGLQVFVSIFADADRTYVTLLEAGRPDGASIATIVAE